MNQDRLLFQRNLCLLLTLLAVCLPSAASAGDALPSWNDGAPKQAIVEFVAAEKGRSADPAADVALGAFSQAFSCN